MEPDPAFQTVDVTYPDILYASGMIIKYDILFFPFTKMQKSTQMLKKYAQEVALEFDRQFKDKVDIKRQLFVMKLKFVKKHPLKKKMWDTPDFRLPESARSSEFIRAIGNCNLYNLIVTPVLDKKTKFKVSEYIATFPYLCASDQEIDNLMQISEIYVSPEAKHAGIYTFEKIWVVDF